MLDFELPQVDCQYLHKDGRCDIASQISGEDSYILDDKICCQCTNDSNPKQINKWTCSLAISNAIKNKRLDVNRLISKYKQYLTEKVELIKLDCVGEGVGTELHKILKQRGYDAAECQSCLALIKEMNEKGSQWCQENSRTIVNNMVKQWQTRNKLASFVVPNWLVGIKAEQLIQEAINNHAATQT